MVSPLVRPTPARRKTAAEPRSLRDYLYMLYRHVRLVILVFAAVFILGAAVIMMMPAVYRADVLVILQPPSVAAQQTVIAPPDVRQRLDALREQVESRRTLDEVIKKYHLYADAHPALAPDKLYDLVRKSISLSIGRSSFTLYFDHPDPKIAADVANELARYYIAENQRVRHQTLEETGKFIQSQLLRLENEVKTMELSMQKFRLMHLGGMPEDVPANQALLTSLSAQVAQMESSMEGERLHRRKTELHIGEMVAGEIAQRQKQIKRLQSLVRQYSALERSTEPQPTEPAAIPTSADPPAKPAPSAPAPDGQEAELKELRSRLDDLGEKLRRARAAANAQGLMDTPEIQQLSGQQRVLQAQADDLETRSIKEAPLANDDSAEGIGDSVEVEVLRQQIHLKEIAARDSDRNVQDMENMLKRGLITDRLVEKARTERDRSISELRIQRAELSRTRARYQDDLKGQTKDLASIQAFASAWDGLMTKAQEVDAQRMRVTSETPPDTLADIKSRIEALTGQLTELRKQQNQKFEHLYTSHAELAREVQEHENTMANLARQQDGIQQMRLRMTDLDQKLTNSAKVQVEYPEMLRKHRTVVDQYESMLRRQNQADLERVVEEQSEGERMVIWDAAIPTSLPYRPKYVTLLGGNFILSLTLAIGLALLLELVVPKFLSSDTLQEQIGLEVLARFDMLAKKDIPALLPDEVPQAAGKVVALYNPRHRLARQFLDASCLLFKPESKWPRVIAVCSPVPGDGKTFIASNLAAALAISNREPTMLIDANLRTPALHTVFGKPIENGLAEALDDKPLHSHPIGSTTASDLWLVTAGVAHKHGTVLLNSRRFRDLLQKIISDSLNPRIILDTPSLQGGADVDVLLDAVDGVLLVVRRGHTPIDAVNSAMRRIPQDKLVGIVFNGNVAR